MKKFFFGFLATILFTSSFFSQIKLPNNGEKFEFNVEQSPIPSSFDLTNADEIPYNFAYSSLGKKVLNFDLTKKRDELIFSFNEEKNAIFNFYNDGELIGSVPGSDLPTYQTNGGPLIIIAVIAACCVKVKYKRTTTSGKPPVTTTTWEVGFDCNCLSISLRNGDVPKAKALINGKELEFDSFTISNNSILSEKDYSLTLAH